MIVCPICQTENNHLAVICASCGSYVQSKIDTLDLFATVWRLIESPRVAFRRIAISSHKNYIFFLSAITGIAFAFTIMWLLKIGNSGIPLLSLLAAGFVVGPALGVINLLTLGLLQKFVARAFRHHTRYKNALAIISYASVPIVLSVIFVLPIEILTFGKFFFSTNPSPFTLKPVSYILVLALDGVFLLWSLILYVYGTKILYDISMSRAALISGITFAIFSFIVFLGITGLSSLRFESQADRSFTHSITLLTMRGI